MIVFGSLEWHRKNVKDLEYKLKNLREEQRTTKKKLDDITESINGNKEELEMAKDSLLYALERSNK